MPGNVFGAGRGFEQLKAAFFDRQKVRDAMDKASRRVMSTFGSYVRQRAKTSIKKPPADRTKEKVLNANGRKVFQKQSASRPGNPPFSHTGILKKFIFFAYDQSAGGVVIGPAKTNQVFFNRDGKPVTGTVPAVLEYGGSITILEVLKYGTWRRLDLRSRRKNEGFPKRYRTVKIAARPFMHPALEAERPKFAEMFKDSLYKVGAK